MQDYRVELDGYCGPLDLLLYLVRRHEIDLNDIPIAKLTGQYLEYLKLIKQIDVELAGEFLVMAATLLEIKSATLLPKPTAEPQDAANPESVTDPRYELVQQLLTYKRFKDAAADIRQRGQLWSQRYPCRPPRLKTDAGENGDSQSEHDQPWIEIDLDDANVMDLCHAYTRVIETIGRTPPLHEVVYDDTPISLHAEDILDRLNREGPMGLQDMFVGRSRRSEKIGLFLATLELVRQAKVKIVQNETDNTIRLVLRQDEQPSQDQNTYEDQGLNAAQGEEYDWPDEETRRRAQRRTQRRDAKAQAEDAQSDSLTTA